MGGKEGSSHVVNVLVLDDGGTLNTLDDWLANNGGWDGVWDGLGNVDWGGDLNDLLNWLDDIIGNIVRLGDLVGFVDDVGLLLDGDNGRVDLGGAPESGGNSDVEVGDGWLENLSGVSGDVGGGAKVNLLVDLSWGLVDGGHWSTDNSGGAVGCWGRDGSDSWGSNGSSIGDSSEESA